MCTLGELTIGNLFIYGTCILMKSILPILFGIALVLFVWGVVKYFFINVNEEAKREEGKQFIIWGLIAFSVMLSIWGLARVLGNTFGLNTYTSFFPSVSPDGQLPEPPVDLGDPIPHGTYDDNGNPAGGPVDPCFIFGQRPCTSNDTP